MGNSADLLQSGDGSAIKELAKQGDNEARVDFSDPAADRLIRNQEFRGAERDYKALLSHTLCSEANSICDWQRRYCTTTGRGGTTARSGRDTFEGTEPLCWSLPSTATAGVDIT